MHFQNDRRLVVGICDVSGHGVASALLAARVNSFVLSQAPRVCHPCQLVDALNEFIFRTFRETNLYVTFFSLCIDLDSGTVVGAGCGHPPVFLHVQEEATVRRLESENIPLGLFGDLARGCSMAQVSFQPGGSARPLHGWRDRIDEPRRARTGYRWIGAVLQGISPSSSSDVPSDDERLGA